MNGLNLESILLGVCSFLVIGIFHPIVIKCEYYLSAKIWPVFLAAGILFLAAALFMQGIWADVTALIGVASLWSIKELKEQEERVRKGWFPENLKRKTKK